VSDQRSRLDDPWFQDTAPSVPLRTEAPPPEEAHRFGHFAGLAILMVLGFLGTTGLLLWLS